MEASIVGIWGNRKERIVLAAVENRAPVRVESTDAAIDLGGVYHIRRAGSACPVKDKLIRRTHKSASAIVIHDVSAATGTHPIGRHHIDSAAIASPSAIYQLISVTVLDALTGSHQFLALGTFAYHTRLIVDQLTRTPGAMTTHQKCVGLAAAGNALLVDTV